MLFNLGEHFPGPAAPEELRRSRDLRAVSETGNF
jgi:hypothetical protein